MDVTHTARRRRTGKKVLGVGAVTASVAMVASALIVPAANADDQTATSVSAAHGHTLWAEGLGLDVLGAGSTQTNWTAAGPNDAVREPLNLSLLGAIDLGVSGLNLPIVKENAGDPGLLWLGTAGVLNSYSSSPSETKSVSSSGVIGADGAIDLSAIDGEPGENAKIDLTDLLDQLQLTALTDQILDEASIELGALAGYAEKDAGTVTREYGLADLNLNLHSEVLDDVTGLVDTTVGGVATSLDALVGPTGALTTTVQSLVNLLDAVSLPVVGGVNASLDSLGIDTSSLLTSVQTELLNTPINNATTATGPSSVNIDLSTGTIAVNVAELLIGPGGPYAGQSLSSLPANTDLLTEDILNAIVSGVTSAITGTGPNSLTTKVVNIVKQGVYGLSVDLNITLGVELLTLPVTDTTITLQDTDGNAATIGGLLGQPGFPAADLAIEDSGVLGALLNPVLGLLTTGLSNITTAIGNVVTPVLDGLAPALSTLLEPLTNTLLGGTNPLLKQVLDGVVGLTANEQPATGDFGAGSSTVRALGIEVLPILGNNAVKVELGSATVQAADAETPGMGADANASASASASASANSNNDAAAEGAAIAAAYGDNTTKADAASTTNANAAAKAAARTAASTDASNDATAAANSSAKAAATASQDSNADSAQDADASTAGDSNAGSASQAAAQTNASSNASSDAAGSTSSTANTNTSSNPNSNSTTNAGASADTNVNASASASADSKANAAAQAAAMADNSTKGDAAATTNGNSASKAAATTSASTDAASTSGGSAQAAASAAANSSSDSDSNAEGSAAGTADSEAASKAAANASASTDASGTASGSNSSSNTNGTPNANTNTNGNPNANTNTNGADANVNAAASASADSNANAAAKAAANADATTAASAKATASANAAAKAAATATSSTNASTKADAASKAAAEAAALADNTTDTNAKASAAAKANAAAAAKAAAISNASSNASGDNPNPNTAKCLVPSKKSPFLDTPTNHKFYKEIDWMYCMKYTTGIKSDAGLIYGPQMRLSREAMAAFIFRMEAPKNYKAPTKSPFADMKPTDKFYKEIVWMYESGLSTGIKQASGKPIYGPKLRLSREAMAAFIYRLEDPKGYQAPSVSKMTDMKRGDKFYTEINWMVEEGLSTGIKVENGKREFWPKSRLSREAMAAFIYRLVNDYR